MFDFDKLSTRKKRMLIRWFKKKRESHEKNNHVVGEFCKYCKTKFRYHKCEYCRDDYEIICGTSDCANGWFYSNCMAGEGHRDQTESENAY